MAMIDKLPHLRSCITLQVLSILNAEVHQLGAHCAGIMPDKLAPYVSKLTTYDSSTNGLRQLSIQEVVLHCLNCIFQMQEIASKSNAFRVGKKREIVLSLQSQPILQELARIIGGINTNRSILEELLDTVQTFIDLTSEHPWILSSNDNLDDDEQFQKDLFSYLIKIFKSVQGSFRMTDNGKIPVGQICRLFLSLLSNEWRTSKHTILTIRKALNVCCFDKESCRQVGQHI